MSDNKSNRNKPEKQVRKFTERIADFCESGANWTVFALLLLTPLLFWPYAHVPTISIKEMLVVVFIALAALLLFTARVFRPRTVNWSMLQTLLLIFLGTQLLSLINAGRFFSPDGAKPELAMLALKMSLPQYAMIILAVLLPMIIRGRREWNRLLVAMLIGVVINAIYGIFQYRGIDPGIWISQKVDELFISRRESAIVAWDITAKRNPILGALGNPEYLGNFLAPFAPILAGFIIIPAAVKEGSFFKRNRLRIIAGICLALVLFCILVTHTRGAWLGLMGGAVIGALAFFRLGAHKIKAGYIKKALIAIVALIVILVLVVSLAPSKDKDTFKDRILTFKDIHNIRNRLLIWQVTIQMVREHPVIGAGRGLYHLYFFDYLGKLMNTPQGRDYRLIANENEGRVARQAHNEYFQYFSDTGLIGLAAFIFLIVYFLASVWRDIRAREDFRDRFILLSLWTAMVVTLIEIGFSFSLQLPANGLFIWTVFALAYTHRRISGESPVSAEPAKSGAGLWPGIAVVCGVLIIGLAVSIWQVRIFTADLLLSQGIGRIKVAVNNQDEETENLRKAREALEKARELDPLNGEIYYYFGVSYSGYYIDFPKSLKYFERSLDLFKDRGTYLNLARLYDDWSDGDTGSKMEYLQKAEEYYRWALSIYPNYPQVYMNLGTVRYRMGDVEGALAAYREEIAAYPENLVCYNNMANILYNKGLADDNQELKDQAVDYLLRALRINPYYLEGNYNLGMIYARSEPVEPEKALYYLGRALRSPLLSEAMEAKAKDSIVKILKNI